ncbi:MAG: HAMP domain-containing protein [Spirochaetaceae bacterium]|jgi:HPt (histidine-containing phosphotransfer) domain-containing protein/HAMP domain-containing protein|nr:HAMP domain-containing protein [Spirochaetaceae bacterium]
MKKSFWKRILVFDIIPFIVIYIGFSAFIMHQTYQTQIKKAGQELHKLALYNSVNLKNFYEVIELSAQIAAAELEKIDPESPAARDMGEHILAARFRKPQVINAWLAFEPNAFDGMDALHTEDYPGAPSGRYIRFLVKKGSFWEESHGINEADLEDEEQYRITRDTGAVFTDLGGRRLLGDYGGGMISRMSVTSPVFRNGRIIGCVGLDAELNEYTLGEEILPQAVSAIFLPDGRLGYSVRTENVGKDLEALGFPGGGRIRDAMDRKEPVYLYNEYSGISRVTSSSYFYPVQINDRLLYIGTSIPQQYIWLNTIQDIEPIGISLFASLVVFTVFLLFLSRTISMPLKKLITACEALASGNLDVRIDLSRSTDELGMITKSLNRMAEQFRTSKLLQRRYQDRIDILMEIHQALLRGGSLSEAFYGGLEVTAEYFGIHKAALIFIAGESPLIRAVYPSQKPAEEKGEFFNHNLVVNLLGNKQHVTMNYGALSVMQLPFIDFKTKALCILPLRTGDTLRGYIIMEGKEPEAFIHDDTTLIFMTRTLSSILDCRTAWEQEVPAEGEEGKTPKLPGILPPENAALFLEKAKVIQNLNIEQGLLLIGGEKEKYTELLQVTIKVITGGILTMRSLYQQDLPGFAIEVHGMKSALYTIGAEPLGDEARQLEFAAKSDDAAYCAENYPAFEEKLRTLSRNLAALFPRQERGSRAGSAQELRELLEKALDACGNFDAAEADKILVSLTELKWNDQNIAGTLAEIGGDLENLEYDGARDKISRLLETLGNGSS